MPLRLMCLTAHPDDEAGAFGAALLRAAECGIETSILCLTEGAAGSYREPGQSNEELAALRRDEFVQATEALHIGHTELMQYPDGGLWKEPFLELVETFVRGLRTVRPHIVLTFGGEGGVNLHLDHTVVSLAGTAAFHWAGRSPFFPEQALAPWAPQKLYYASTSFIAVRDEEVQRIGTRVPPSLTYQLTPHEYEQKWNVAFGKHTSQRGVLERVRIQFDAEMHQEQYLLVAARNPLANEKDLWDGVAAE